MRIRITLSRGAAALAVCGGLALANPAMAKDCGDLAEMTLQGVKVTKAEYVPAGGFKSAETEGAGPPPAVPYEALPAFCRVKATMTPTDDSHIEVEIWLPAEGWNGKLVGIGNGVWAGQLSITQLTEPLARGYAAVSTDTGHSGNPLSGAWAVGHPEKLADFGYRAVHEMTQAAKAAIKVYYGKSPDLSLWHSCSTGGRQGLMAAYRYPEDYDIISSLAPANPMTDLMTASIWTGYQFMRSPELAMSMSKLTAVHKAVLRQCDGLDGLRDGIIGDPRACHFDPAVVQCKAGDGDDCLTAGQVEGMRKVYDGVRDPRTGERIMAGFAPGSEMQLAAVVLGSEPFGAATSYMRDLVFADREWDFRNLDYGEDARLARLFGQHILDARPDGLKPFFARGGKLLLSHGWNDGLIPAGNTVQFYTSLLGSIPPAEAQQQVRLFMVPGMDHCAGGEGAWLFDRLQIMEDWVDSGKAPDRIIAHRPPAAIPGSPVLPPLSRPICAYPKVARYNGRGPTDQAASFVCRDVR